MEADVKEAGSRVWQRDQPRRERALLRERRRRPRKRTAAEPASAYDSAHLVKA